MAQDPSRVRAAELQDPFLRRTVSTALHLRRYLPFYVFGTIWAVTLALFPTLAPKDDTGDTSSFASDLSTGSGATSQATGTDPGATATGTDAGATDPAAGGDTTVSGGTGTAGTSGAPRPGTSGTKAATTGAAPAAGDAAAATPEQIAAAIQRGTGKTRSGAECKEGIAQIPHSLYSLPCQNVYNGDNGGATYRGVTDKDIKIIRRKFPESANSKAVQAVVEQAGGAPKEVTDAVRLEFVKYFNKTFELYGRQVKWEDYESENGNSTDEALGKGKEGACLDADKLVKETKAFAIGSGSNSAPFSECAAERKLLVFDAAPYYPETFFRKYHPYLWGGPMECERISYQLAEYIGERLLNKPAKWAGDAITQKKTRYFATYIPDNDGYQFCNNITHRILKEKYGVKDTGPQYNYQLDISRFPDQAAQATVQFQAAGATTIVLACDAISAIVLTQAATNQNYHPEWMTIGTGLTDLDNSARLYDQTQVNGHLFGPSQLGSAEKLLGRISEPGLVYKDATGKEIPEGTSGDYFLLVRIWSMLQAAGPIVTPETIAKGVMTIPPGGAPTYPVGYTSYLDGPDGTPGKGDHTAVDDSREVFWVNPDGNKSSDKSSCPKSADPYYNSADGCAGTYKETYGGKRFRNGEWPHEDPPIYPPH